MQKGFFNKPSKPKVDPSKSPLKISSKPKEKEIFKPGFLNPQPKIPTVSSADVGRKKEQQVETPVFSRKLEVEVKPEKPLFKSGFFNTKGKSVSLYPENKKDPSSESPKEEKPLFEPGFFEMLESLYLDENNNKEEPKMATPTEESPKLTSHVDKLNLKIGFLNKITLKSDSNINKLAKPVKQRLDKIIAERDKVFSPKNKVAISNFKRGNNDAYLVLEELRREQKYDNYLESISKIVTKLSNQKLSDLESDELQKLSDLYSVKDKETKFQGKAVIGKIADLTFLREFYDAIADNLAVASRHMEYVERNKGTAPSLKDLCATTITSYVNLIRKPEFKLLPEEMREKILGTRSL
jgi:hypothetical protein